MDRKVARSTRTAALTFALAADFFEQLNLDLLDFEEPIVLTPQEVIDFFVQVPDLQLGFEVDFVIVLRAQTIAQFGAILTHHDDWRLHRGETREDQIQQDEWIRVEPAVQEQGGVQNDPKHEDDAEENDESPAAAKRGYLVGQPFAESELPLELLLDVAREDFMLVQTFDDFLIEDRKFAEFVLEDVFDIFLPELAEIIQTDKTFPVPIGHALLDEFEERRPDQFCDHSVVRRFRSLANLANKCGRRGFTHRISLSD